MVAAIYTRISRDADERGAGVARQERDCRAMLERAGYGEPVVFCDNNRSAWKRDRARPGWDALLEGIQSGHITALAIWVPDRLMRQPYDLELLIRIADRGLPFFSAGGGRDLGNADDRFVLRIETAAACKASDDASRRLRRFFEDHARTGKAHGGPRPFGLQPNRVDHEPTEVEVIRNVAQRLLAGESLRSVTAALNATQLRPTRSTPKHPTTWSPVTVRQMLLRPSIAGLRFHKGVRVGRTADAEAHGPILDNDTWTAVCALLRSPTRRTTQDNARRYLLSGIARCGACQTGLRRTKTHGHPRYWCGSCFRIAIAQEPLDAYVSAAVIERLRQVPKPESPRATDDNLGARIFSLQVRLDELTTHAADTEAEPIDSLLRMIFGVERKLADLRSRQAATLQDRVLDMVDPGVVDRWDALPLDRRRAVIRAVIESLTIRSARGATRFTTDRIDLRFRKI